MPSSYTHVTFRRSLSGYPNTNDFARQLAERNASSQAQKKFRSTAAPKGSKLAAGYTDRTKDRTDEEADEKAGRVKALEEMWKLQQIDEETFKKLRDEIVGGDVGSTHLVKGLDFKLLERVRRGEDVLASKENSEEEADEEDIDDELERLEEKEVVAKEREDKKKKGEMAPPSLLPGKKRNRDQILAEMKAARLAAKEAAQPSLGSRFKKVGAPRSSSRIERDSKGREVLITVDEDGNEKRKVRKIQEEKKPDLLMLDKDAKPLGMEVPEIPKATEEEDEDLDIFDDAGDDYNPLAGLEDDEDDSEAEEEKPRKQADKENEAEKPSMPPPSKPSAPRNYFGDSKPETETLSAGSKAMTDPTIMAAIKKASTLNPLSQAAQSEEEKAREEKRRRMLMQDDRDAQDMDMGFGGSRFEDGEEGEERIKLSEWGGAGGDDDGEKSQGKSKRKRGPKKRKGDKDSAADVLGVLERRKAEQE
jgi:hypothetical protein